MLYETFEGFTYSFVDKNDPKLWSGDRNWTAPIDADDELVITKISSPRVAKLVSLRISILSQTPTMTQRARVPVARISKTHLWSTTISQTLFTPLTHACRVAVGNVGLDQMETIGRTSRFRGVLKLSYLARLCLWVTSQTSPWYLPTFETSADLMRGYFS